MSVGEEHKIWIGGLDWNTREKSIERSVQSVLGSDVKVSSVKLLFDKETGKSKGYAFVGFLHEEHAKRALEKMDGMDIDGRKVKVNDVKNKEFKESAPRANYSRDSERLADGDRYANERDSDRGSKPHKQSRRYRVAVTGLPESFTWDKLKDFLRDGTSGGNTIQYANITHPGFGVGDFITEEARDTAIVSLDNTTVDGCRIRVKIWDNNDSTKHLDDEYAEPQGSDRFGSEGYQTGRATYYEKGGTRRSRSAGSGQPADGAYDQYDELVDEKAYRVRTMHSAYPEDRGDAYEKGPQTGRGSIRGNERGHLVESDDYGQGYSRKKPVKEYMDNAQRYSERVGVVVDDEEGVYGSRLVSSSREVGVAGVSRHEKRFAADDGATRAYIHVDADGSMKERAGMRRVKKVYVDNSGYEGGYEQGYAEVEVGGYRRGSLTKLPTARMMEEEERYQYEQPRYMKGRRPYPGAAEGYEDDGYYEGEFLEEEPYERAGAVRYVVRGRPLRYMEGIVRDQYSDPARPLRPVVLGVPGGRPQAFDGYEEDYLDEQYEDMPPRATSFNRAAIMSAGIHRGQYPEEYDDEYFEPAPRHPSSTRSMKRALNVSEVEPGYEEDYAARPSKARNSGYEASTKVTGYAEEDVAPARSARPKTEHVLEGRKTGRGSRYEQH
ncbi:hypothetical protein CEUSTIGMA_g11492.t1 [Chlamydomonas eustigma]|uniref:RRM domain-containing protein n=1 Tax=Chlamydomonas eustigma TaxID=1157962 RepID=A0A250XLW9_9CHLO|nr:hypothetical protein CEUSTIGMA_g11492.t1 [Chlamydomonas eustigma]|eukprot:GAX84068.1 hypothetical protein CEUSTIGMA_g11492.t1 [Chlamydomonas eustigma]